MSFDVRRISFYTSPVSERPLPRVFPADNIKFTLHTSSVSLSHTHVYTHTSTYRVLRTGKGVRQTDALIYYWWLGKNNLEISIKTSNTLLIRISTSKKLRQKGCVKQSDEWEL